MEKELKKVLLEKYANATVVCGLVEEADVNLEDTKIDITFENIEVFATYNKGAINVYIGGSGGFGAGSGIVKNIHFNNITVKHNYDLVLNLQTYDAENCFIYDLYLNNVVSNGELFTKEKLNDKYYRNAVVGGYSEEKYLHINEE